MAERRLGQERLRADFVQRAAGWQSVCAASPAPISRTPGSSASLPRPLRYASAMPRVSITPAGFFARLRGDGFEAVEIGAIDREHEARVGTELADAQRQRIDEARRDRVAARGKCRREQHDGLMLLISA